MSTWLSVTPMRNSQKLPLHTSSLVLEAVPLLPAPGLSWIPGIRKAAGSRGRAFPLSQRKRACESYRWCVRGSVALYVTEGAQGEDGSAASPGPSPLALNDLAFWQLGLSPLGTKPGSCDGGNSKPGFWA